MLEMTLNEKLLRTHDEGDVAALGNVHMRVVVPGEATGGSFSLAEFRGGEGPWTVPHIHQHMEESFYVLDGNFVFTVGGNDLAARSGDFVLVPRGTPHFIQAQSEGALLTLFAPAGLEKMFLELGSLPAGALTDPKIRAEVSHRHDSVPV